MQSIDRSTALKGSRGSTALASQGKGSQWEFYTSQIAHIKSILSMIIISTYLSREHTVKSYLTVERQENIPKARPITV